MIKLHCHRWGAAVVASAISSMALAQSAPAPQPRSVRLDIMDVSRFEPPAGDAERQRSIGDSKLRLAGKPYIYGISTYANAQMVINLSGNGIHFSGLFGVDDECPADAAIDCKLLLDGRQVADSGPLKRGDAKTLATDLAGAKELTIVIDNLGSGAVAHADIIGGVVTYKPGTPRPDIERRLQDPDAEKIPPMASGDSPEPEIHDPHVAGTTPGRPFVFLIPATGKGALSYSADELPAGLSLDPQTGIITGSVKTDGVYNVPITVSNDAGKTTQTLTIVAGKHKLAQTPPMGWNSWNAWGAEVNAQRVRQAADALISTGLAAKGFQYVNIDDGWEAGRDADGTIQANEKFGDVKALADYVHSKGLRLGIYSSPGPKTCGGYEGSYQHELQDAQWYARMGVDYLKYDWCTYSKVSSPNRTLAVVQKPYRVMADALDTTDRDIVFSFCEYGVANVWEWGAQLNGNLWRTTGDITDTWTSMAHIGFGQGRLSRYATVGHWNDPDMLVVGKVSWGAELHPSRLTPAEQVTHITLWSMLSAPLLLGCDLTQMDQFTLDLMGNPEVIAVDQDRLGRGGEPAKIDGQIEVWKKSLSDGTTAVAVFNRGRMPTPVTVRWTDIGLLGSQDVRDLWLRKDLGKMPQQITVQVPRHGAVLLKVGRYVEPLR